MILLLLIWFLLQVLMLLLLQSFEVHTQLSRSGQWSQLVLLQLLL